MTQASAESILDFWFGPAARDPVAAGERAGMWFGSSAATDEAIRSRFMPTLEAATRGDLAAWQAEPRGALALVLLLDQFPRNAWRGSARAFDCDPQALATSRAAVAASHLARLSPVEQAFMILPFEHSEALADQHECVRLFCDLAQSAPEPWQALLGGYLQYARQHLEIIERFGRFPHRNRVLGRESTAAELEYLHAGGAVFGQG
ncbi:MAG TPA: DUF924 family protein [Steroidobacteraceae bacterium]|nr:DUF924 family protein [Steroidobacteraceae bacterium]HNS27539.1 DUF924 family protein [Steroidobacteraceae bacterium]